MITPGNDKLPGRRAIWAAIRELRVFTRLELRMRVPHVPAGTIKDYLHALAKGGYLRPGQWVAGQSQGTGKLRQYELARDVGVDAPRLRKDGSELPPTAQQNMWLAMDILGTFSVESLASHASTDDVDVPVRTAASYVRHLYLAGYLREFVRENSPSLYRLVKNTGGLAPLVQRTKVVFDPNTNTVVWNEDVEE